MTLSPDGIVLPDWPPRPCKACGERKETKDGYCKDHRWR